MQWRSWVTFYVDIRNNCKSLCDKWQTYLIVVDWITDGNIQRCKFKYCFLWQNSETICKDQLFNALLYTLLSLNKNKKGKEEMKTNKGFIVKSFFSFITKHTPFTLQYKKMHWLKKNLAFCDKFHTWNFHIIYEHKQRLKQSRFINMSLAVHI